MTNSTTLPSDSTVPPAAPDDPAFVDPRPAFARSAQLAGAVIDAVRADQRQLPTPCEEFDVGELMGHLLVVLRRVTHIGRGEGPFGVPPFVTEVPNDDWAAAWAADAAECDAAWADDATLTDIAQLPWTRLPGWQALGIYVSELLVHTWDLASATGQRPAWDDDDVELALAAMRVALPAEGRTEAFEAVFAGLPPEVERAYPFADAVAVPADAAAIERLVAHNGRRP